MNYVPFVTIEARTSVAGLHYWPLAPASRFYLSSPHRHQFVARVTALVGNDERQVEFHDLGDALFHALVGAAHHHHVMGEGGKSLLNFGIASCETIARRCSVILTQEGYDVVSVSVSEDDEFTATVHLPHNHEELPA